MSAVPIPAQQTITTEVPNISKVSFGGAPSALAHLLQPMEIADFLRIHWEKRPLHIARADDKHYGELLSISDIERFISRLNKNAISFNLVSAENELRRDEYMADDRNVDIIRVFQLFGDGYSIVLNHLNTHHEPLGALCEALEREFSMRVQANVYLSPSHSQGFKAHHDTHDVFIVQISGSKKWEVYEPTIHAPMRGQPFRSDSDQMGKLVDSYELGPGDITYIPRGWVHKGVATDEPSLHVTVGILSFTWAEFLIEVVSAACARNSRFRGALPVGYSRPDHNRSATHSEFRKLWKELSSEIEFDSAFDNFVARIVNVARPDLGDQFAQVQRTKSLTLESAIEARMGAVYDVRERDGKVSILAYGRETEFPSECKTAIMFALNTPKFCISDLPDDIDEKSKLVLIKRLVLEGLVTVKADG